MKTSSVLIAGATLIPLMANAEEFNNDLSLLEQYKQKDVAITIELGTYLVGHNSLRIESEYNTEKDNTFLLFGAYQNLSIGFDIKGAKVGIDAIYQKYKPGDDYSDNKSEWGLGISVDLPLIKENFSPIVSIGGGIVGINLKNNESSYLEYEIDEVAFKFMVGLGARYYINEHTFFKTLLTYQRYSFDTDLENPYSYEKVKLDFANQTFGLTFSIGYKF